MRRIILIIKSYYLQGKLYKKIIFSLILALIVYFLSNLFFNKFFNISAISSYLILLSYWAISMGLINGWNFLQQDKKIIKLLLSFDIPVYEGIIAKIISILFSSFKILFFSILFLSFINPFLNTIKFIAMLLFLLFEILSFFLLGLLLNILVDKKFFLSILEIYLIFSLATSFIKPSLYNLWNPFYFYTDTLKHLIDTNLSNFSLVLDVSVIVVFFSVVLFLLISWFNLKIGEKVLYT